LVLIDFDLTITTKDTTSILGEAALRMTGNPTSWSFFTDAYMDDYRKHRGSLPPSNDTSIEAVARRLDSYRHVEAASVTRISEHQVFRGLTKEQLRSAGIAHQHLLRPGVLEALQLIPHLKIVSLNWSKDWILGMLDPLPLQRDQIHCNDLEFQHELATGLVVQRVLTTMDKKKEVQAIKDALSSSPKKVIYIGDSLGDLLPLVEADIGIVIGNNETLLSTL
ncbi:HAD-like domain-containing protein, partial [Radiomyces spectabilis]|uniref:HAD-like domain-containing protein n=1 Tax=Radiomyces spectabilis TaxID=64574 RepID=UPI0022210ADF